MSSLEGGTANPDLATLANRVRQTRNSLGWTLDELADRSGVSRRTLINVEKGAANASIAVLLRISTALGVSLASLVEEIKSSDLFVRRDGAHKVYWSGKHGGEALLLTSTEPPEVVELWDWRLGAGDEYATEGHSVGTRELLHVLNGKISLTVGPHVVELRAGDALWFKGDEPHEYSNPGTHGARFSLAVYQPGVRA